MPTSELVTSFSSKSEGALNLSTNGRYVSFMGYAAPSATIDVSNSNTPGEVDPTNPVTSSYYRAVATLDADGQFHFTETNAYSGDNGRAAIVADSDGSDPVIFMAGNAGNGSPHPAADGHGAVLRGVLGAGAQSIAPSIGPGGVPEPRHADAGRELRRHAARRQAGQDRQGRQLPRPDDLQQRPLLHQGQRQQRRQHRVLRRHHRQGLPRRRRRADAWRDAADRRRSTTTWPRSRRAERCRATCAS